MTKTLETSTETKILVRARELVEQGWTQGTDHAYRKEHWWSEPKHFYCVGGAIGEAAMDVRALDGGDRDAAWDRLRAAIGTQWIASWNDYNRRTKEEVLAALDTAISRSMGAPRLP